eukprot:4931508-Pleurochrysis_carterae.AAC.3
MLPPNHDYFAAVAINVVATIAKIAIYTICITVKQVRDHQGRCRFTTTTGPAPPPLLQPPSQPPQTSNLLSLSLLRPLLSPCPSPPLPWSNLCRNGL